MKESKRTFIVEVKYPECDKLVDADNYLQELIEGDLVGEDVGRWCVNVTEVVGDIKRQLIMNKEVFIVTCGEYSDYRIDAIFSTNNKAEEYVQQKGDYYRIETHSVDSEVVNVSDKVWVVELRINDHKVLSCSPSEYSSRIIDTIRVFGDIYFNSSKSIEFVLVADSMDKAKKIANERLNQVLAGKDMFFNKAFIKKR